LRGDKLAKKIITKSTIILLLAGIFMLAFARNANATSPTSYSSYQTTIPTHGTINTANPSDTAQAIPLINPFSISIITPENSTYVTGNEIPLNFTLNAPTFYIMYDLDVLGNVTITGNTTLTGLPRGSHSITIYASDTFGYLTASATIHFTVTYPPLLVTILLGLIQGLAEWLPISSTAHLIIAEKTLTLYVTPLLNVTLHLGTLIVVIFYFRKDVKNILAALVHLDFKSENGSLIPPIIVATLPTAIIGLFYVRYLENTLQTLLIIGITFLIGAIILFTSKIGKENRDKITYSVAILMGTAQGLAIFPGLSRSGITISAALLLGLKREKAFKFSFLLSIPAILGDLAVEAYKDRGQLGPQGIGPTELLIGIIIAMIAGYIAIKIVQKLVTTKRFHYFAIYTAILGITIIALVLTGLTS
jgi:undecaprenyl-diphosphatase